MSEEHTHTGESITIKKDTMWKVGTFVFAILFVVSLFTGGFGGGSAPTTGNTVADTNPTPTPTPTPSQVKVEIEENDPVLGDKDAPVTIVEFSDFQCPYCEKAYSGAVTDLKNSDYFKNGEVNLVFKHLPLDTSCNSGMSRQLHPNACKAAEAAECANKQGKFWEYHDKLFENQQSLGVDSLKQYAVQVGLNTATFNKCLDGGEATTEVKKEINQANSAGGSGTPYFIVINNDDGSTYPVSGAVPFSQFEAAINAVA